MEMVTALLGSSWHWLAAIGVVIAGLFASYFGGKKVGTVQTQAKADVTAAQKDAKRAEDSAAQRVSTTKAVENVRQDVNSMSDGAVDQRLRDKWTKN